MIAALLALGPMLLFLLSLSGLISAAETSMTACSRGRMHQLERDGDRAAARVNRLLENQESMIGAILLSNNVINILASAITTVVMSRLFPGAPELPAVTVGVVEGQTGLAQCRGDLHDQRDFSCDPCIEISIDRPCPACASFAGDARVNLRHGTSMAIASGRT